MIHLRQFIYFRGNEMIIDIRATKLFDNKHVVDLYDTFNKSVTRSGFNNISITATQNTINKILGDISPKWKRSNHLSKSYLYLKQDDQTIIGMEAKLNNTLKGVWASRHTGIIQVHLSKTIGTVTIPDNSHPTTFGLVLPISELKNEMYYSPENAFNLLMSTTYVDDLSYSVNSVDQLIDHAICIQNTINEKKSNLDEHDIRMVIVAIRSLLWVLKKTNKDQYCGVEKRITKNRVDSLTMESYESINDLILAGYYFVAKTSDWYGVIHGRPWR